MSSDRPIAVIGATGQQGGATLRALRDRSVPVRAIVRDPAQRDRLGRDGVEVVVAELDDGDALRRAFVGTSAVFAMTTMAGPDGTDGEVRHGRAIADAALATQVPHLVYSSVGGAERDSGVPHFDSKWQVEQYLRGIGVPTVVLRPTFFMDNFLGGFEPVTQDGTVVLRAPLVAGVPLQMIAVRDIGRAAATALSDPDAVPDGAVEIAGDELTAEAIAEAFGAQESLPGRFEPMPIDALPGEDMRAMFRWLAVLPAYQADMGRTEALVGDVTRFEAFVGRQAGAAG